MTLAINALPLGTFAPTCAQITDDAPIHEILDTDTEISGVIGGGIGVVDVNTQTYYSDFESYCDYLNNSSFSGEELDVRIANSSAIAANHVYVFPDGNYKINLRTMVDLSFSNSSFDIRCDDFSFNGDNHIIKSNNTFITSSNPDAKIELKNFSTFYGNINNEYSENPLIDIGKISKLVINNCPFSGFNCNYCLRSYAKENVIKISDIASSVNASIFLGGENNFVDNCIFQNTSTNAIYINCADLSVNCIMTDCSFNGTCTADIYVSSSTKVLGNVPRVYIIDCTYTTLAVQNNVSGLVSVITTS